VPLSHDEFMQTSELGLPFNLFGDGLPRTGININKPVVTLNLYEGRLISSPDSSNQAVYVRNGNGFLVSPLDRYADYQNELLKTDKFDQVIPSMITLPKIQDQDWYLTSPINPFTQFNGKVLMRSGENSIAVFVYNGIPYVFDTSNCSQIQDTVISKPGDTVYNLLPLPTTTHLYKKAEKEPFYKKLLPECSEIGARTR
jgi:hypothetical protein